MAAKPICSAVLCLSLGPFVERLASPYHYSITVLHSVPGDPPYYREKHPSLPCISASPEATQKTGGKKTWINFTSNSQPFRWPLGARKNFDRHWTDSYANSSAFYHQHHTVLRSQDREKADFLEISLLA